MSAQITASFRWTSEEALLAQRVELRNSPIGRKYRRCVFVFSPIAILGGAAILLLRGIDASGLFFLLIGTAFLASPFLVRRMTLKHYAKRPDRNMVVTWDIYSDRLDSKTPASSSTMAWSMISKVLRTTEGFLLYPNDQVYHWLPVHAFRDAQDVEAFAQLAKSHVQQFDHVA